jgi:2-polyprenyl-3-methyl-5-hydroxy-6-metoxy-1,4-benzoquinol methylase
MDERNIWTFNIPKDDYYENMYDIENLTALNRKRKNIETLKIVKEFEEIIKQNNCLKAFDLLEKYITNNQEIENELVILYGALYVKNLILEDKDLSPKESALIELEEYLKIDKKEIEKLMLVEVPVDIDWKKYSPNPKSEDEVNEFYMKTNSYIYELMAANHIVQTLYSYFVLINKIKDLNINTILDYGAGAGTLCILLKKLGYNVIYADLPGKTYDFAKFRFDKRELDIRMLNLLETNINEEEFDCILSTEVVEHVVDSEKLINEFSDYLKKDQYLIVSESCEYTEDFASHLEHNKVFGGDKFIGLTEKYNFKQIKKDPLIPQMIFRKE